MIGEKLVFSLYVTVIGLVIVFAVLLILILFASLTKYANLIPSREDIKAKLRRKKEAKKEYKPKYANAAEEEPAEETAVQAVTVPDDEIQAVIAAAIAAYLADCPQASPNGIVVRSVRRANGFNAASRNERINNRI